MYSFDIGLIASEISAADSVGYLPGWICSILVGDVEGLRRVDNEPVDVREPAILSEILIMKNLSKGLSRWRAKWIAAGTFAVCAVSSLRAEAPKPADVDGGLLPGAPGAPMLTGAAGADGVNANRTVHKYDIPAGTVDDVISAIAAETKVHIHVPKDLATLQSPGVKGVLTLQEALTAALKGTSIAATFNSADHVSLGLRAADQSVTVTDNGPSSLKYTTPLRDLPQTVTVIPESVIENTGSTTLVEALRTVPGITFGAGEGGNPIGDRPFIRGVDSQASTYLDGMRDIGSQSREVFDIESIEVAKGANGTTGGRGTSGGSLNLNSKMARRGENFLRGNISPGTASFYRGTLDGNVKLTDSIAFRMNGMRQDSDVAGRDVVHNSRYGFAPAVSAGLTKTTRLNLNYYHLMSDDMPDPGIPYNNPINYWTGLDVAHTRTDGRTRILQEGDGQPLSENLIGRRVFYGLKDRDFRYEKVKTALGRLEQNIGNAAVLRNTFRYGKSNQDYLYSMADDSQGNIYYGLMYRRALNRNTVVDTAINQTDLAGSGKTGKIEHNYAVGAEFSRERGWNNNYTVPLPFYGVPGSSPKVSVSRCPVGPGAASNYDCTDLFHPDYNEPWRGASVLAYDSATGSSSDTLKTITNTPVKNNNPTRSRTVTRSLYGFDTVKFLPQLQATLGLRYDHYNAFYQGARLAGVLPAPASRVDDLLNYQVGVVYKPTRPMSIYGSVNTSAIPSGNALVQGQEGSSLGTVGNNNLNPEKTRAVETGVKYEAFHSRALLSAAFFQSNTDNARININPTTVAMAGKRRNRGVETGIAGKVNKHWQIFGGYTFMQAIIVDGGVTTTGAPSPMTGTHFPNTPQHSFSLTSYYSVTRALTLGGGVYAMSKVWGNESTNKWVPGYSRTDVYGSYRFTKHYEAQVNVQNLFNKYYFSNAYATHFATLAPGRQARVTLNILF